MCQKETLNQNFQNFTYISYEVIEMQIWAIIEILLVIFLNLNATKTQQTLYVKLSEDK